VVQVSRCTFLWSEGEQPLEVIGVVQDYFFESKHRAIRPHALMHLGYPFGFRPGYLCVRVNWLENFVYRVPVQWWIFLAAGILAFIIALATVSVHAIRASRMNPGISLRHE